MKTDKNITGTLDFEGILDLDQLENDKSKNVRLVVIESPYAGKTQEDIDRNIRYARSCLRDCFINHNEYPFASHLLYTQPGILDDQHPKERRLGMEAGLAWVRIADATIVYTDLGITSGMDEGIRRAQKEGRPVEYRVLGENWKY